MLDRERGESESDRRRFDVKRFIPAALRTQDKTVRLLILFYFFDFFHDLCPFRFVFSNRLDLHWMHDSIQ